MDNRKILDVFDSNTYKNILDEFNSLHEQLNKYVVLTSVFTTLLDKIKDLISKAKADYNNELEEWLKNPQNTCDHTNCRHRYIGHGHNFDMYEIVCQDCGKVLGTFRS